METYSTRGLPASRKLSYWNRISSETFAAMEVRPRDRLGFDGLLSRAPLGPLTLMDVRSAAARIRHTRAHIARTGDPSLLLLAPLQHSLQLSIDGGPIVSVNAGEFCCIDHARPYEIMHGDAVRTLCIDVPRRLIAALLPRPEQLAGRLMRPDTPSARLLAAALRCLGEEMHPGATVHFSAEVAHGLLNLIAAAYEVQDGAGSHRRGAGRAQVFRERIDACLGDPYLRPADLATHFSVSERYVRAVLGKSGECFSSYLLRRRLERCAALLVDPAWGARSITDIAFHAGFGSLTHFGRSFKARFGSTPREHRRRGLGATNSTP
ncbi:MAG: helix-turn-helix domain-containing protein [Gammaproteobacteria bacterium]|nr:helix-turn-helix domain-containing protein [Gammaproteobacteria bacterium]